MHKRRKYGIECNDKWYDHQLLPTAENGEVRITWDMNIYTYKVLKHNRPDITLVHKDTQKWILLDVAVPAEADQNITRTEEEKVEKDQELAFEIRIHGASKVTIIPIVTGALGSISKGAKTWFGKLDVPDFLGSDPTSLELLTCCGERCVSKVHNKHYPVEHLGTGENKKKRDLKKYIYKYKQ